jgi:hypothetical protein
MEISEVKKEIINMPEMAGFAWDESSSTSLHAFLPIEAETFKDSDKNEYRLGGHYSLFIAHMYKGEDREFFYMILCRNSEMRCFRKHRFEKLEYNKVFSSGSSVKELMKSFKGYFTKCDYKLK